MKKIFGLLLLLLVACVSSCSKDDSGDSILDVPSGNTYTVTANMGLSKLDAQYGSQSTMDIVFYEYNDKNEMIAYKLWENVKDNEVRSFSADQLATKLVIYIEMETILNGKKGELNEYVAQVFYLNKQLYITLDGKTRVSKYSPL